MRVPYTFVQQQLAKGTYRPSFVSSIINESMQNARDGILDHDTENTIMSVAGIMYGAGADTTATVLSAFILAMVMYPEVQQKAQQEIDTIIGNRLPDFKDKESLPYVSAVTMEAMRWFPITPINTAHAVSSEIHYKGYRIPKGSHLLVSTWWLLHDPNTYHDPTSFSPERFLERNEPDPATMVFGYGRRICPGRYVADKSLFITISRILATFTIGKGAGQARLQITPGLIAHPMEFPFEITPRSPTHAGLVQAIEKDNPWEKADAGLLAI
ncbi:Cytochrome P450 [Metarhizium brunneum]